MLPVPRSRTASLACVPEGLGSLRRRVLFGSTVAIGALWMLRSAMAWNSAQLESSMAARFGAGGVRRLAQWQALLQAQRGQPVSQQLRAVNDFWNQQVLASLDSVVWKTTDYWATPLESLGRGEGDCEDFVIAKYFSLTHLGVPAEQLRFVYVRARVGGAGSTQSVAHMVLGYYATPQAEPLVLDNLVGRISPASGRPDLTPVFSFDAQGVYVNGQRSASTERINRWQDLLVRMRKEGFTP